MDDVENYSYNDWGPKITAVNPYDRRQSSTQKLDTISTQGSKGAIYQRIQRGGAVTQTNRFY